MTDVQKRRWAGWLLAGALICAVAAAMLWAKADDDANGGEFAAQVFNRADPEPDHTPSVVLAVVAGLGLVCSVILYSSAKPENDEIPPP